MKWWGGVLEMHTCIVHVGPIRWKVENLWNTYDTYSARYSSIWRVQEGTKGDAAVHVTIFPCIFYFILS